MVGFVSFDLQALTRLIDVASCQECFLSEVIRFATAKTNW